MFQFLKKLITDTKSIPFGIKLVVLVIFFRTLGWGFVDPFFSIFIQGFTSNYTGIGALVAVTHVATFLMLIPLIRLASRVKDTTLMKDGQLLYFFAVTFYILAGLTGKLAFLIPAFIFNGLGYPLIHVGAETYIRKNSSRGNEATVFGFYMAFNHLGWILGMIIGAFTVHYYGLNWMFLFILPSIVLGLSILKHIQETGLRSIFSGFARYFHKKQDFKDLFLDIKSLDHRAFFFLLLSFFDGVIFMFIFIFVPLFALSLNLSLKEISLLMAVTYLPFIFSFIISEATNGLKKMHLITAGFSLSAVTLVLMAFNLEHTWLMILAAATSLSLAIIRPAYNGMLTHLTPAKMAGEVTGLNNIMMRLGYILGPIATGYFADEFGLIYVFFAMAVFSLLLAVCSLLFKGFEEALVST